DRRTIFIHDDPDLKARYPLQVGADGASSPAIADLDGDGVGDIVFGTSNGLVYAKHADGSDLRGWPVATDPLAIVTGSAAYISKAIPTPIRAAVLASVAIGDIDGDGLLDVVAADVEGKVYAWDYRGRRKPGFPVQVNLLYSSHAVRDPANTVDRLIIGSPALSPANSRVYAIHEDGNNHAGGPFLPGWPFKIGSLAKELLPVMGEGINASPARADVDGNGRVEIGVFSYAGPAYLLASDGTSFYGSDPSGNYLVMATDGYPASNSPDTPSFAALGEGAFGALAAPGALAFAAPAAGLGRSLAVVLPEEQLNADDHTSAWVALTGKYLPAFPH